VRAGRDQAVMGWLKQLDDSHRQPSRVLPMLTYIPLS
jgi:hypothetical protein